MSDTVVPSQGTRWSLWKSANIGLFVSSLTLLLQIGNGRGFELANYAHTASTETIGALAGQILGAPLIFVLIAALRNLFKGQLQPSNVSARLGAVIFVALFGIILIALIVYGKIFFSSSELIGSETREKFVSGMMRSCVQKQLSLAQNIPESEATKYCACLSEKVADKTTYEQIGTKPNAIALQELKQRIEAAASGCL